MTKQSADVYQRPLFLLQGDINENPEYLNQIIKEFRDNPLIEALPDILSPEDVSRKLVYFPEFSAEYSKLPMQYRLLMLENSREFFIPLSRDIELYYSIANMVRRSYIPRNPILSYFGKINEKINNLEDKMDQPFRPKAFRSRARGLTIVGTGGTGKSTSVENSLLLLPQVIEHKSYKGTNLILKQLVWLKIDCPQDGSAKGLCLAFFAAIDEVLGTSYFKTYIKDRTTVNAMLLAMARVAAIHCLGVLVIDEIQDLSEAKSGGASHLMNFFVNLENTIGVPFILIGTPKALPLFKGEIRQARRASEQGDFLWKRLEMTSYDHNTPDPVWNELIRRMWSYQYVSKVRILPANILDEPATKILYNESQGIIAIALTIFVLSQRRAILSHVEEITPDVIKSAVKDNQNLISQMMDSFRLGKKLTIHGEVDFEPQIFRRKFNQKDHDIPSLDLCEGNNLPEEEQESVESSDIRNTIIENKNHKMVSTKLEKSDPDLLVINDVDSYVKSVTELL